MTAGAADGRSTGSSASRQDRSANGGRLALTRQPGRRRPPASVSSDGRRGAPQPRRGRADDDRCALVQQRTQFLTRAWVRAQLAEKRQDERVSYSPISAGRFHQDSNEVDVRLRRDASSGARRRRATGPRVGDRLQVLACGCPRCMGVELVWSASALGGTSSMPTACVESGSAPGPFRLGSGESRGRSSGRSLLASARRSRHRNPRYRSAGIVTLEPWRLVAPWIGHTYPGAALPVMCAGISPHRYREQAPRSRSIAAVDRCLPNGGEPPCRSARSWGSSTPAGTDVWFAWLERPVDAEIARGCEAWAPARSDR